MHRRLAVRGVVRGTRFRPWVWHQANELGLVGWVRDTGFGVEIDVHGEPAGIDALQERLWQAPPPARVERIDVLNPVEAPPHASSVLRGGRSADEAVPQPLLEAPPSRATAIGTDIAVCRRCLAEICSGADRRWRGAFTHCPQCGPRYSIMRGLPFARHRTSMAHFQMCAACQGEYTDGRNRRHRHETNCCPACGPRLWLRLGNGHVARDDPIAGALHILAGGGIVAVKGQGGFHLFCDARQPAAVTRLRQRKGYGHQPLAVMMANAASVQPWGEVGAHEARWLESAERPIVLLKRKEASRRGLHAIAPGLDTLGVALPCTPIHHLLFHEASGQPEGLSWLADRHEWTMAMTSANRPGEPMLTDNDAALRELCEVADAWLLHDREILSRIDDSVLRVRADGSACFMRRGRGHAPIPTALPTIEGCHEPEMPAVLAMGSTRDATLCITQGERALVSPHIGCLAEPRTQKAYVSLANTWPAWLDTPAQAIACEPDDDGFACRLAAQLARQRIDTTDGLPLPLVHVRHDHAHIAAVLAEHAEDAAARGPVLGLLLDGPRQDDGLYRGGELLHVHGHQCSLVGRILPMPLHEEDVHKPHAVRMAASMLHMLGRGHDAAARFAARPEYAALPWAREETNATPWHGHITTSVRHLFDAAAGLLDVLGTRAAPDHAWEAPMGIEGLASACWPMAPLSGGWQVDEELVLDWRPLMNWLADVTSASDGIAAYACQGVQPASASFTAWSASVAAAVFHTTLAAALASWAIEACRIKDLDTVVLAGECLMNRLLEDTLTEHLRAAGLRVWRPTQYPCGDGALSLGQAWVARQMLAHQSA